MEKLENIKADVKEILSEKRYMHSIGVMERASELAKMYNEDEEKAALIGIAHDLAKEMTPDQMLKYCLENNIEVDEIEKINTSLLHGKIAADVCKKKYGFTDDMVDAIKYHTTGNPKMDKLAKIIYLADKTEKYRPYDDLIYARELANKDMNKAIIYCLDLVISYNLKDEKLIHPDTVLTRNKILMENK